MTPINKEKLTPITLESITQKKLELQQQIQQQKEIMILLTREIIAPVAPATGKANQLMRAFHTGMAAFDGILLGIKMMRKVRKLFR